MEQVMQQPWFEKYRPKKIEDVVFEDENTKKKIHKFIDQGWIQGNILSYGPGGTGKTTVNKVLGESIIKNIADVHYLGKGVKDIEKLKDWLLGAPQGSKQMIVIAEEFDRLSKEAQVMLKDGLMEKYMPKVSFLCTTNNIHTLDNALLQRFNEKLNFATFNIDGVFFRMEYILNSENIKYDRDEVYQLVTSFKMKGIRDLINNLQSGCIDGEFKLEYINNISTTGMEDVIISYIKYILNTAMNMELTLLENMILNPTKEPSISEYYLAIIKFCEQDLSMNYDYIYTTLIADQEINLAVKTPIQDNYQMINLKPLKHIHLQSGIFDMLVAIYKLRGGLKCLK